MRTMNEWMPLAQRIALSSDEPPERRALALRCAEEAARQAPGAHDFPLGLALFRVGRLPEAIAALDRAESQAGPSNLNAHAHAQRLYFLTLATHRSGDLHRAQALRRRLETIRDDNVRKPLGRFVDELLREVDGELGGAPSNVPPVGR